MEKPDDVAAMLRLHAAGWGSKRIALELGCARNTVRRYLRVGGWVPYAAGGRTKVLDEHASFVQEAFERTSSPCPLPGRDLAGEVPPTRRSRWNERRSRR